MATAVKEAKAGTHTLDLALRMIEFLARQSGPASLGAIAEEFASSKATVYRHLQTLKRHKFVRQDEETGRYDIAVKMLALGEACRSRFDIVAASRADLVALRDATEQAVTLCALIDDAVVVLELIQGRTFIEFGTRPGTRLAPHASAHGKVWLAFGPQRLLDECLSGPLPAWTQKTISTPTRLRREIAAVRARGWATAPDQVIAGVNALAAPVRGYNGDLIGSVAIVGACQYIAADPDARQSAAVLRAVASISRTMGWKA